MAEDPKRDSEDLVRQFKLERLLNQDQSGRRTVLYGRVRDSPAILLVERASFPQSTDYLASIPATLAQLQCLNANDIYSWHLARTGGADTVIPREEQQDPASTADGDSTGFFADLKINLICPCTESHVKKYSKQAARFVTETPEIYASHVRPYMERQRAGTRLNWVYNIIEGRFEAEDVIYRTPLGEGGDEGFLLTPDLNWDRVSLENLRLLAIVERRDLWSIRDLRRSHVPWLRHMKEHIATAVVEKFPGLEPDQLKLYFHYQPTYYHMHIHVVNVALEPNATQATGKAVGLESIMEMLELMNEKKAEERGMEAVSMSYSLGEAHELWTTVFEPLKRGAAPHASAQ